MNQGKLEVVKQERARVNVDILGISELKWTGMGEFNSDVHFIYIYIHTHTNIYICIYTTSPLSIHLKEKNKAEFLNLLTIFALNY